MIGSFRSSEADGVFISDHDCRAGPISLKGFFWAYAIIPVMLVIFQLVLAPSASYQRDQFMDKRDKSITVSAVEVDEGDAVPIDIDSGSPLDDDAMASGLEANLAGTAAKGDSRDLVIGVMFDRTPKEQITSTWFFAIVFFLCIFMCRINYLIQTVFSQLLFFLHDVGLARSITTTFTVLLPLGGIVGIPFVGYLLDDRTTLDASLVVLVSGVVYGALGILPHVGAQVTSIAIFVFLRPLMYTFVGDYCGK
ncbi:hypothetical protein FRB96_001417 [Tulasnella sp. 330]|nr:hypothetical protein FRB96_001417 [Tulasnella sp. 330]KAG8878223.1 hypothetical protein FRB97_002681 [Tulasnella sp. 331]